MSSVTSLDPLRPAWLVDDARFDAHALRENARAGYHPERPERLTAARAAAAKAAVDFRRVTAREATFDELGRVHEAPYLEALEKIRGESGALDPDTYFAPGSVEAARRAAGGVISMVDAMIDTEVGRGVALVRPPGHHARPGRAMGFCLLNTIAVAAAHARARGLSRVLVLDWDVHHGNGTQEMFFRTPDVLYVSTHQFPFYPGTGALGEDGEGDGRGFTVNVPLAAGGDDGVYRAAFERVILPIAEEYAPDLVLVSAGFDASARDPLANMRLDAAAFGWMARALAAVADKSAKGRIAMVLEGGYDLIALEAGVSSAIEGLVNGRAKEVASDPDHADVVSAAAAARRAWGRVV
jgi:acetoin utilization deacetylase AcuC-like enzyme